MIEYVSYQPTIFYCTIHKTKYSGTNKVLNNSGLLELDTVEEEFHIYGLLRTHEYLKYYIDDIENITYVFKRSDAPSSQNRAFSQAFYPFDDSWSA